MAKDLAEFLNVLRNYQNQQMDWEDCKLDLIAALSRMSKAGIDTLALIDVGRVPAVVAAKRREREAATAMTDPRARSVEKLVLELRALFADKSVELQSLALADLLATLMAGYSPALREEVLRLHVDHVRELIPLNAEGPGEREPLQTPSHIREVAVINAIGELERSCNVHAQVLADLGVGPNDRVVLWCVRLTYYQEADAGDWAFINTDHKEIDDGSLRLINCPVVGLTLVRPVGEQLIGPNGKTADITEEHRQRILGKVIGLTRKVKNVRPQL
jgi:hypothetical protein